MEKDAPADFPGTVRQARLALGLDAATLAAQAGLTPTQVEDAESGRWVPGTDAMFRLAYYLELDPERLARLALGQNDGPSDRRVY